MESSDGNTNASKAATALAAETASNFWEDPDEDHLLKYFLSNDTNQQNLYQYDGNNNNLSHQATQSKRNFDLNSSKNDFTPVTPSIQFYGNSVSMDEKVGHHRNSLDFGAAHTSSSSSSLPSLVPVNWTSSSSLSSINANANASNISSSTQMQMQNPGLAAQNLSMNNNTSNIVDHNLMLPPPRRLPHLSTSLAAFPNVINEQEQAVGGENIKASPSHLEWLKQMNSLARQTSEMNTNQGSSQYALNVDINNFKSKKSGHVSNINNNYNVNMQSPQNVEGNMPYFGFIPIQTDNNDNVYNSSLYTKSPPSFSKMAASIAEQNQFRKHDLEANQKVKDLQNEIIRLQNQTATLGSSFGFQQRQIHNNLQQSSNVVGTPINMNEIEQGNTVNKNISITAKDKNKIRKNVLDHNAIQSSSPNISMIVSPSSTNSEAITNNTATIPPQNLNIGNAPIPTITPSANFNLLNLTTSAENDDKRARRLARNRESARLSRLRKKEHLQSLSEKVNHSHQALEKRRRELVNTMESELKKLREREIMNIAMAQCILNDNKIMNLNSKRERLDSETSPEEQAKLTQGLMNINRNLGPSSATRRAVISYQYNLLRQLRLPIYHQFFLWLTFQSEMFFFTAKERRAKSPGRLSSKQIGEEISTTHAKKKTGKSILTCNASDQSLFWPLFSYEIMLSVEQEEKILQGYKRLKEDTSIRETQKHRSQTATAITVIKNLRKNVEYRSHLSAHQCDQLLLNILSPQQTILYLTWLRSKRKNILNAAMAKQVLKKSPTVWKNENRKAETEKNMFGVRTINMKRDQDSDNSDFLFNNMQNSVDDDKHHIKSLDNLCRTLSGKLKVDF